jgi:hypothetical protein
MVVSLVEVKNINELHIPESEKNKQNKHMYVCMYVHGEAT